MEKSLSISLNVGANDARMGQKYGPIIGQYGVNIKLFCDEFNKITQQIYKGIPMRIIINVDFDKSFKINIKGFLLKFYIFYFLSKNDNKGIFLEDIYLIVLIDNLLRKKYKILDNSRNISELSKVKILISYIKGYRIKILDNKV